MCTFVTYASGDLEHDADVLGFVKYLRNNGFNAVNDKMLAEKSSSADWWDIMLEGFGMEKVIVVLSPLYFKKSHEVGCGVYRECKRIRSDIENNHKKYIFVVFSTPDKFTDVCPEFLDSRNIIDLSKEGSLNLLFSKLDNKSVIPPMPISDEKPDIIEAKVNDFMSVITNSKKKLK